MSANQPEKTIQEILKQFREDLQLSSTDYAQEEIPADRMAVEFETAGEEALAALSAMVEWCLTYQVDSVYPNNAEDFLYIDKQKVVNNLIDMGFTLNKEDK